MFAFSVEISNNFLNPNMASWYISFKQTVFLLNPGLADVYMCFIWISAQSSIFLWRFEETMQKTWSSALVPNIKLIIKLQIVYSKNVNVFIHKYPTLQPNKGIWIN